MIFCLLIETLHAMSLHGVDYFFKRPIIVQAVHFFLLDVRFAAGKRCRLNSQQNGDDLIAEALPDEAANLQVAVGQGGILRQKPFGEIVVGKICQFDEILPVAFIKVESQ